jgi:receptor protein-tyrosine kinase
LAVIFSQLGEKTLLIDADMRNPRQHALFGISNSHGLAAALTGRANEPCMLLACRDCISCLPSSINAQELLGRPAFAQLLAEFSAVFDVILIDTPASSEYADISTIAARTGAALVVVRQNHSLAAEVKELGSVLNQGSVNVVGTVLNNY